MSETQPAEEDLADFYEVLQISPNAEPDTIHRVYRLLAQRFHPDNTETGDDARFRIIHRAYLTLSDPEERVRYDLRHGEFKRMRWRAAAAEAHPEDDFEDEQLLRLTVLEVLYSERRAEPEGRGIFVLDLEDLTGRPREHLEFTLWFLKKKHLIESGDSSRMNITVEGVEYFEEHYRSGLLRRRLKAADAEDGPETSGEERAGKREPR